MSYKTTMIPWASGDQAAYRTTSNLHTVDDQGGYSALGFSSTNYLVAQVFNGILKEVSLVTVSLLSALVDLSIEGDSSSGTDLTNETSQADFTTALKALITNQKSMNIQTLECDTIETQGGYDYDDPHPDLFVSGGGVIGASLKVNDAIYTNGLQVSADAQFSQDIDCSGDIFADGNIGSDNDIEAVNGTITGDVIKALSKLTVNGNLVITGQQESITLIPEQSANATLVLPNQNNATLATTADITSQVSTVQSNLNTVKNNLNAIYEHNIRMYKTVTGNTTYFDIVFTIRNNNPSTLTKSGVKTWFEELSDGQFVPCTGFVYMSDSSTREDTVALAFGHGQGFSLDFTGYKFGNGAEATANIQTTFMISDSNCAITELSKFKLFDL